MITYSICSKLRMTNLVDAHNVSLETTFLTEAIPTLFATKFWFNSALICQMAIQIRVAFVRSITIFTFEKPSGFFRAI